MSKPNAVSPPATEFIVNLSIISDDAVGLQRILDDLKAAVGVDADLHFSGDAKGAYSECLQRHLKAAAAFSAKARVKAVQTNFNF